MDIAVLGIKAIPARAGADRVVERLLANYSPENHYWIYIRKDTPDAATCHDNLHFIHVPGPKGKHLGAFGYFLLCCVHYLLKGRYDVAHVHNSDFGFFVPLLRLKPGVRVVSTFHGDPYTRDKWGFLAKAYFHLSEWTLVGLSHVLTSVSRFKDGGRGWFGSRSILYIPNGVDPLDESSLDRSGFDYEGAGLHRGDYLLFACGRLDRTKGLDVLLDAFAGYSDDRRLLVLGDFGHDPAYADGVRERAAADPRIVLHEQLLPRETLLDVLQNCRVFIFPSLYEAMSMMLLEAVSCKRPIVSSDIPPNVAVLGEGYPYLYPTASPDALRERLEAILLAGDGVGDELWERCREEFDWRRIASRYEAIYAGSSNA